MPRLQPVLLLALALFLPLSLAQPGPTPTPRPTVLDLVASLPDQFGVLARLVPLVPTLPDTLSNPSATLTVFAPTDQAFTRLLRRLRPDTTKSELADPDTVVALLAEALADRDIDLADILTYHALPFSARFRRLLNRREADTVQGSPLRFRNDRVIDIAPRRKNPSPDPRDLRVSNGWVHVIDVVLLPLDIPDATVLPDDALPDSEADDVPDATIPNPRPTILGLVAAMPDTFGVLARAVAAVDGLGDVLDNPAARLTVFAPTDPAFAQLANTLTPGANLDPDDKDAVTAALVTAIAPLADLPAARNATLETILSYHALGIAAPFQELEAMRVAETLQGQDLRFRKGVVVDGDRSREDATADPRDVFTQNGWVHVIDSVLLPFNLGRILNPPGMSAKGPIDVSEAEAVPDAIVLEPPQTILDFVTSQPDEFGILGRAVAIDDDLVAALKDEDSRLTVFAPADRAFADLANKLVPDANLGPEDKDAVVDALVTAITPLADLPAAKNSTLASILAYHTLGRAAPTQMLETEGEVVTLQGDTVTVAGGKVIDGDVSRVDATVVIPNIFSLNGWVHTIDSVLLPFNLGEILEPSADPEEESGDLPPSIANDVPDATVLRPGVTILDYLQSRVDTFSVLILAATVSDNVAATLNNKSARLTFFPPTNEAFLQLAKSLAPDVTVSDQDAAGILDALGGVINSVSELPSANGVSLESILYYHLLTSAESFQDLKEAGSFQTVQGGSLTFKDDAVVDADSSRRDPVPDPRNILATNGWVHVIDSVLLPFDVNAVLEEASDSSGTTATDSDDSGDIQPNSTAEVEVEPSPEDEDDDGVCFPASATIRLADGSSVPMHQLEAGTEIHVGRAGETSHVFAFTHRSHIRKAMFYSLTTASGHIVTLTGSHYLYANRKLTAASAVRVGDTLQTRVGESQIVNVRRVRDTGLFAPHTLHGDLEVDGVVVSGYSRALHPKVAHGLLLPIRLLSKFAGIVEPLGNLFYDGADRIAAYLPKGSQRYE